MILEITLICIIGSVIHFTYELSHHNKFIGWFSAINESTWEHIKIGLTGTFILSIFDYFILDLNNYFFAKLICMLLIIFLIPLIFYSYLPFTKKAILPVDIISFYIVITISQYVSFYIMNLNDLGNLYNVIGIIGIIIIFILWNLLSFYAPKNFIFKDPITHKYGLEGHPCHHDHGHKHDHNH